MMNVLISVVVLAQRGVPTCNRNFSALGFVIVWKMHCARRQSATAAEIWRVPLSGNFGIEDISYDGYRINCCCCAEAAPHFTVPSLLLCARCFSFVSADSATKKKKGGWLRRQISYRSVLFVQEEKAAHSPFLIFILKCWSPGFQEGKLWHHLELIFYIFKVGCEDFLWAVEAPEPLLSSNRRGTSRSWSPSGWRGFRVGLPWGRCYQGRCQAELRTCRVLWPHRASPRCFSAGWLQ